MSLRRMATTVLKRRHAGVRWLSSTTTDVQPEQQHGDEQLRRNPLNIQMLSRGLHEQLFPHTSAGDALPPFCQPIAVEHLQKWELDFEKSTTQPDVDIDLPPLQGASIAQHFETIGRQVAEPYLSIAKRFAGLTSSAAVNGDVALPSMPQEWKMQAGWTRYGTDGSCRAVDHPDESDDCLVFDVEVCMHVNQYPTLAVAMSQQAWYAWVSPQLLDDAAPPALISMGPGSKERIIIGHNVGFDRARIHEEYQLQPTRNAFLDTLSLHMACSGMCSQQRPSFTAWQQQQRLPEEEEEREQPTPSSRASGGQKKKNWGKSDMSWCKHTTTNSLAEVSQYYLSTAMNKEARNVFIDAQSLDPIRADFQRLMTYCANDVLVTAQLFRRVFPRYLEKCSHPVSFAGALKMASCYLPTTSKWTDLLQQADAATLQMTSEFDSQLLQLAYNALRKYIIADPADLQSPWTPGTVADGAMTPLALERYRSVTVLTDELAKDCWLGQLDWTITPLKLTKKGVPYKRQTLPNYPEWFRELWDRAQHQAIITQRKRASPLLLGLTWNGFPLFYSEQHKWLYRVDRDSTDDYKSITKAVKFDTSSSEYTSKFDNMLQQGYVFYKVPHKDGDDYNTGNPFSKSFFSAIETGILRSEQGDAAKAMQLQLQCSYWQQAGERIRNQFVVWDSDFAASAQQAGATHSQTAQTKQLPLVLQDTLGLPKRDDGLPNGVILPQTLPMGTITRRSVEATWMTASNAKKNRIGSDVKRFIEAPAGWRMVGADVDSEELWISSLIGDAQLHMHGATALGWMNLQGSKTDGTDLHSVTANILGISRNDAKQFNYARIYGAGVKFAKGLLRQFNPNLSEKEAKHKADVLYQKTKGKHICKPVDGLTPKSYWMGGRESYMFNSLEAIARADDPRTPVLKCQIPDSLLPSFCGDQFLPSRINWVVQSSGVDYLHLLIVSAEYLLRRYNINARFMISIHDELRYLVKEEDRYRFVMVLQISNLWTRALFAASLGMNDLPLSVSFFSAVDVDHVLRKEVNDPCITPTNKEPVPQGESLTIYDLLSKHPEVREMETASGDSEQSAAATPAPPSTTFDAFPHLQHNPHLREAWLRLQMMGTIPQYRKWRGKTETPHLYPNIDGHEQVPQPQSRHSSPLSELISTTDRQLLFEMRPPSRPIVVKDTKPARRQVQRA
ncbi:DNA-directed DNA polymerase gamma mip1 [Sorochytrium milnesiophthora]